MNLQNLNDEIFKQEQILKDLKEKQKNFLIREANLRAERNLNKIDSWLEVIDDHSRTSCSDDNIINHYHARCLRCFLLNVKKEHYWDPDVKITFFGEIENLN